jgi:hypothetical protein
VLLVVDWFWRTTRLWPPMNWPPACCARTGRSCPARI